MKTFFNLKGVSIACALVALSASAHAGSQAGDAWKHLPLAERAAAYKAALAKQARQRAASAGAESQDITPPELKRLSVTRQATPTFSGQQVLIDLTVTDDWSGLEWGQITAARPDGSDFRDVAIPGTFGGRSFSGQLAMEFPASMPAGEWKIVNVTGVDANGNSYWYDESALGAFGNLSFKLSPMPSEDHSAPELRSGKVLTPVVYLSRPAKGTDAHPAMARIELTVVDRSEGGESGVSGVRRAELLFCSDAPWGTCFNAIMSQPDSIPYGTRDAVFLVGQVLDLNQESGNYVLKQATVEDWLGMYRSYDDSNTDFSSIFGKTTSITIKR